MKYKYFIGVCIRSSGHAAVTKPYKTLAECENDMRAYCKRHSCDIRSTTYMTRESDKENLTLEDVFGHPKSRDLMQNKKFLTELTVI